MIAIEMAQIALGGYYFALESHYSIWKRAHFHIDSNRIAVDNSLFTKLGKIQESYSNGFINKISVNYTCVYE